MKHNKLQIALICVAAALAQGCSSPPKSLDVGAVVVAPKAQRQEPPVTQAPPSYNFQQRLAAIFGSSPQTPKALP